jgi:hypothetical protein
LCTDPQSPPVQEQRFRHPRLENASTVIAALDCVSSTPFEAGMKCHSLVPPWRAMRGVRRGAHRQPQAARLGTWVTAISRWSVVPNRNEGGVRARRCLWGRSRAHGLGAVSCGRVGECRCGPVFRRGFRRRGLHKPSARSSAFSASVSNDRLFRGAAVTASRSISGGGIAPPIHPARKNGNMKGHFSRQGSRYGSKVKENPRRDPRIDCRADGRLSRGGR